jgi:stage II sporulation protein AA (anti-sigma F factor antagonist)
MAHLLLRETSPYDASAIPGRFISETIKRPAEKRILSFLSRVRVYDPWHVERVKQSALHLVCPDWRLDMTAPIDARYLADRDAWVISPAGEYDIRNVDQLAATLGRLVAQQPKRVVLDLTEVTFIDSSLVNALLCAHAEARRAGAELCLVLRCGSPPRRVVDLLQVSTLLECYGSLDEALAHRFGPLAAPAKDGRAI